MDRGDSNRNQNWESKRRAPTKLYAILADAA